MGQFTNNTLQVTVSGAKVLQNVDFIKLADIPSKIDRIKILWEKSGIGIWFFISYFGFEDVKETSVCQNKNTKIELISGRSEQC